MQAAIYGFEGPALTDEERRFFRDAEPAGFILFRRNIENPEQLLRLTDSLRELSGRDEVPILIDQEGGRVARMRPPEWPAFPAAERFADLYRAAPSSAIEAVRANARAIGLMLRSVGVNVDALPLLDVRQPGASDIIGDRALGDEPMQVAALGRAVLDGLASAGVVGIVKHIPGHGRALVDSHHELPIVTASAGELEIDLEPFERLASAPNDALAGATPYLRLFGSTLGGCKLAEEALAARDLGDQIGDTQRYVTLARFFAENISVQAPALERTVIDSADAVNGADAVLLA